jgi:hypothetical protein
MMGLSTTHQTAKRRGRSISLRGVVALALVASIADAGAATADNWERQGRAACTRDAFVHCPLQALAGNHAHVRDCLIARLGRLSDACRTVINAALAEGVQRPTAPGAPRVAADTSVPSHKNDQ